VYGWCIDSVSLNNIDTMKRLNRIVIYPQDVAIITGRSDRYGRMIIKRIKEHLGKEQYQFVTIKEFAEYMAIEVSLVETVILGD